MRKGAQKSVILKKIAEGKITMLASIFALSMAASATQAYVEQQEFTSGINGGVVTFTNEGVGANQLKITFDNTSLNNNVGPNDYLNSSLITGIVFNITQDINSASILSFEDKNGLDLTSYWTIGFNVDNETTPDNTTFDVAFETSQGVTGGIYNSASPGSELNNAFPDIATLIIQINDPNPWNLTNVGDDSILRMQRVGEGGEDSLKIVTSSSSTSGGASTSSTSGGASTSGNQVSEPGILALLGIGLLAQAFMFASRRRRLSL